MYFADKLDTNIENCFFFADKNETENGIDIDRCEDNNLLRN